MLLKHYLELYITNTALKLSRSLYCFTSSISHGVDNYFHRLWVRASLMLFFHFKGKGLRTTPVGPLKNLGLSKIQPPIVAEMENIIYLKKP